MSREENIEKIRKACIEANPEIETRLGSLDGKRLTYIGRDQTIRLADVLLVVEEAFKFDSSIALRIAN